MRRLHLPTIDGRYWLALTVASVAGANLGDLGSHDLGLGHWRGLPVLAVLFGLVLAGERLSRGVTEVFYWAAILLVRAAATNLADLATHDFGLPYPAFVVGMALVLAGLAVVTGAAGEAGRPSGSPGYWLTMLAAGVLGTALGDFSADLLGLGTSLLAWTVVWAATVAGMVRAGAAGPALALWAAVTVVRTVGTNAGDYLAGRHGMALGLPAASAVTLCILVLLLVLWRPHDAAAAQESAG